MRVPGMGKRRADLKAAVVRSPAGTSDRHLHAADCGRRSPPTTVGAARARRRWRERLARRVRRHGRMPAIPPTLVIPGVVGTTTLLASVGWPIVLLGLFVVLAHVAVGVRVAIEDHRHAARRERRRPAVAVPRPAALSTSR
jgi:hypothetical protein